MKMWVRILIDAVIIIFALTIIYLQREYLFILPWPRYSFGSCHSLLMSAAIIGILFGSMGCTSCALPLSFTLINPPFNLRNLLLITTFFSFSRFLPLFFYSLLGNIALVYFKKFFPLKYIFLASGLVMIVFAILIFNNKAFNLSGKCFIRLYKVWGSYILWGFLLGFGCALEASGFLIPLWSWPEITPILKITSLSLFSLFSLFPMAIAVVFFSWGLTRITFLIENATPYLRNLASFYLFILGIMFVIHPS